MVQMLRGKIFTAVVSLTLCGLLYLGEQHFTFHSDGNSDDPISTITKPENINCHAWKTISDTIHTCVAKGVQSTKEGDLWNILNNLINNCSGNINKLLGVQFLDNFEELKGFIDYVDEKNRNKCTLVTLGVGKNIEAERKLLKLVPKCRLYGADPILESGQMYKDVGEYFNVAVSGESGTETASVLENGQYRQKTVPHLGFVEFVTKMVNISTVDFLYLDAEGAEYKILPLLISGGPVDLANISICQIAAELHGPVESYGIKMAAWEPIVKNFLTKSDFIPLWSETAAGHYRIFFINFRNPICVRKFFFNWCCTR